MEGYELVAKESEFEQDGRKEVIVDDVPVLLIKQDGKYYAIEDVCSHDGQPLTDGPIENCQITCPRHGAKFDLATGAALCMPATEGIPTYDIKIEAGEIWLCEN
ncbi:3-phenylpropionate/cinnamic acid dioxygenase ferredoxin subunit [Polystyrenella longa]|uniref:3-phenylpropionate/cinnamic acid dioxygenase ferredoxin subunit n=1 Tax=Polystyrenella longa TaxID=2528007 RepID=A0A518CL76_9PLAN|nr:non-heme iron oxygenase ferredoxin subunit [Polystyrenella longa]QDU79977.1 3-phenylpropionate/cinnamic acid dioxygenase ferredoxin subunit [Polystyrenella longa]